MSYSCVLLSSKGLITWRISARAGKKNAITWEISARAETEFEGGNRCFLYLLLYTRDSTHAFMNFQQGLKFLVDHMGKFNPINRAENLISGSSNRAEVSAQQPGLKFSSCNRKLRFTRIL